MIYEIIWDFGFIAEVHNSAKVWVAYDEYTINVYNLPGITSI